MENVTQKNEKSVTGAIKIDEKEIGDHLNQLVLKSVEGTINICLMLKQMLFVTQPAVITTQIRLDSCASSCK